MINHFWFKKNVILAFVIHAPKKPKCRKTIAKFGLGMARFGKGIARFGKGIPEFVKV